MAALVGATEPYLADAADGAFTANTWSQDQVQVAVTGAEMSGEPFNVPWHGVEVWSTYPQRRLVGAPGLTTTNKKLLGRTLLGPITIHGVEVWSTTLKLRILCWGFWLRTFSNHRVS